MIHPGAAADQFLLPLHRNFLIFCFVSGAAALLVLPLHLALIGPPQALVLLVLAWMFCQWPLALYLSQSGNLDLSIGISASLFACFIAILCVLTGGLGSFALPWLLVPPVEAAFSLRKKTAFLVTALCAVLLAAIAAVGAQFTEISISLPLELRFAASLVALLYLGVLALRVSGDRHFARNAMKSAETKRQLISQSVSDIFCEIDQDGIPQVVGGALADLLGSRSTVTGEDWLFPRLHVADRPLYLTQLADVSQSGAIATFNVRLRVGASAPGEQGQAEYRTVEMLLRRIQPSESETASETPRTFLKMRLLAEDGSDAEGGNQAGIHGGVERISGAILERANREAREAFARIELQSEQIGQPGGRTDTVRVCEAAELIGNESRSGDLALKNAAQFLPDPEVPVQRDCNPVDLGGQLDHGIKLIAPVATERGVEITCSLPETLPLVLSDERQLHRAFVFVLHEIVETAGHDASVSISAGTKNAVVEIVFEVSNRTSSLKWSSHRAVPILEYANSLLGRSGASVSTRTNLGLGDAVVLRLPAYVRKSVLTPAKHVATDLGLAKSA